MQPDRWATVKRIVADAMERDPPARAAFVAQACRDDAAMRAEVERLLAAHDGADSLFDEATRRDAWRPDAAPVAFRDTRSATIGTIARRTRATPQGATATPLPAELLERSARRLGALALIYAVGFLLGYLIYEASAHLFGGGSYHQTTHTPGQVMTLSFIVIALLVHVVASRRLMSIARLAQLALAFEVVGSLGIGLVSYSGTAAPGVQIWGVSWICVWIMMFPLVVPGPPRGTAIAALASASMGLLAIGVWSLARHAPVPPLNIIVGTTAPNFVCAVLSWLGARHIYRIGVELHEAKRLGSYRLVSRIGRGGMGEVWVAEHDLLARPAALKLVRPDVLKAADDPTGPLLRFEREAQSIAALTSPHTVRLYDFGRTGDDVLYYVMELLDGLDLDTLVRRFGPVVPNRAIHFMQQVCASLDEAHARGLIHRDIKPSNIFTCRQGLQHDFVKVLDFGIVRPRSDLSDAPQRHPPGWHVEGSPGFIAPEAIVAGVADPRTDLYSLGCVGYGLITGGPVFEALSPIDALMQHVKEPPIAPSRRGAPDLPAALEVAIMACLEKDPGRRPPSARALADLLRAVPLPVWDEAQAKDWWDRHMGPHRMDGPEPPVRRD